MLPNKLGCFGQVAGVVGEEEAFRQLEKVILNPEVGVVSEVDDLGSAFLWGRTPQGCNFWKSVHRGEVPEELRKVGVKIGGLPEFGDMLHIQGDKCVVVDYNHDLREVLVTFTDVSSDWFSLNVFDEYPQTEEDKLREQVLKDWESYSKSGPISPDTVADFFVKFGYKKVGGPFLW